MEAAHQIYEYVAYLFRLVVRTGMVKVTETLKDKHFVLEITETLLGNMLDMEPEDVVVPGKIHT